MREARRNCQLHTSADFATAAIREPVNAYDFSAAFAADRWTRGWQEGSAYVTCCAATSWFDGGKNHGITAEY
jgi:hypothetical protein